MKWQNLTLLRYPGGKFYARKKLTPFFEAVEYDEYREPFFGGGAIFWSKEKSKFNWINDIDPDLINLLNIIKDKNSRLMLLDLFKDEKEATKEQYEIVKNMSPKNKLEEAYKYFYLNRTSFSGKMKNPSWGYRPKRSVPPYRWHEKIIPCGEKLQDVYITSEDYRRLLFEPAKGKQVLLFLDPPYFEANQVSHYVYPFTKDDHFRLSEDLKNTQHKFILTYDDVQEIRELYSWAYIYDMNFYYRIDNSRDNNNKRTKGRELVITNFKVEGIEW